MKHFYFSLDIDVTPCILSFKNGDLQFHSYDSIFKKKGYDDSWIR